MSTVFDNFCQDYWWLWQYTNKCFNQSQARLMKDGDSNLLLSPALIMFFVSVSQTSVEGRRKVGAKQWPLEKVTKIETWMGNWRLPLETRRMQIFIPGPPSTLCHNRPLWEIRLVHYPKVISWLSFFLSISRILFPASIPVGVATCTLSSFIDWSGKLLLSVKLERDINYLMSSHFVILSALNADKMVRTSTIIWQSRNKDQ